MLRNPAYATLIGLTLIVTGPVRAQTPESTLNMINRTLGEADRMYRGTKADLAKASRLRPENTVRPTLRVCNPGGTLSAAFRGGRVGPVGGLVNGRTPSPQFIANLTAQSRGSLWEFYDDGTFLYVPSRHKDFPFYPVRGTYTWQGDRVHFDATRISLIGSTRASRSISGDLVLADDGTAIAYVTDEEIESGTWKVNDAVGGYFNERRNRYTVSMTSALHGRGR